MTPDPKLLKIIKASSKHCAALFYAQLSEVIFVKGSANAIEGQGTMTFVEHEGRCFGITNGHVTKAAEAAALNDGHTRTFFLALNRHRIVNSAPIFTSDKDNPDLPQDIAIFEIPLEAILDAGKTPLSLDGSTTGLVEGTMLLAVGFPGRERKMHNASVMEHRLYHVVGTCVAASDRLIALQENLPDGDPRILFGGMSGGPIFSLPEDGGYRFEGVLFEGRGFGDVGEGQAEPNPDIWIYGFPFCRDKLCQAVASGTQQRS